MPTFERINPFMHTDNASLIETLLKTKGDSCIHNDVVFLMCALLNHFVVHNSKEESLRTLNHRATMSFVPALDRCAFFCTLTLLLLAHFFSL